MKASGKPLLILLLVFVFGGVAGAGVTRAYMLHDMRARFGGPPGEVRVRLRVEAMRRQLDLTPPQVDKIEAIFRETDPEMERAMKPCQADLEALRKATDARITAVLDEAQRKQFEDFHKKRKHLGSFAPPPFPPPPGPLPEPSPQ